MVLLNIRAYLFSRLLEENKIWEEFQQQVEENINEQIDYKSVMKKRRERKMAAVKLILNEMESEKKSRDKVDDFTEDQKVALWESFREDVKVSDAMRGMRTEFFRMTLDDMRKNINSDFKHFVTKLFSNQDHERIHILSEKRIDEDQLEIAQNAKRFLQEVEKRNVQRLQNKINQGYDLHMKEEIQLMQLDDNLLTPKLRGIFKDEKETLIKEHERDIKTALNGKAENYIYLRRNQKYLLQSVPVKNFNDGVIKDAKRLLLQDMGLSMT